MLTFSNKYAECLSDRSSQDAWHQSCIVCPPSFSYPPESSVSSSPACGIPLSVSSGRTGVLHPERPQMAHHWPTAVIRWGASSPSRLRSLLHKGQVGAKVVFESLWACVPALGKNPEALSKSCDSELPVRLPGQVPHSIGAFRALQS